MRPEKKQVELTLKEGININFWLNKGDYRDFFFSGSQRNTPKLTNKGIHVTKILNLKEY